MNRKIVLLPIIIVIFIYALLCSCSGPSGIYIDIKNQAIYACDGKGLKEIRIENDFATVTLRSGTFSNNIQNRSTGKVIIASRINCN
jgi:hypothetical protein